MDGVGFMGYTGLGTLVVCRKAAGDHGRDLRIANVGDGVRMVLEIAGMDKVLTPYESVEHANQDA